MLAVKAEYENGQIRWLEKPPVQQAQDVIVVFQTEEENVSLHKYDWMRAQSSALNNVWDNDEDAEYDGL